MASTDEQPTRHPSALPNFFLLGAAKAGTTSIYAMLDQHPQIFLPKAKETGYFSWDEVYERGQDAYLRTHFAGAEAYRARGDATPGYLVSRKAMTRLLADIPEDGHRFLVILRDPVERAWSHYRYNRLLGVETASFPDALADEPRRLAEDEYGSAALCYRLHSSYGASLAMWMEAEPRERFCIVRHEDLGSNPGDVAGTVFAFLGVDPGIEVTARRENAGGTPRFGLMAAVNRSPERLRRAIARLVPPDLRFRAFGTLAKLDRRGGTEPIDPAVATALRAEMADDVRLAMKTTGLDLSGWLPD